MEDGISLPTDTRQNQECQTAGGTSPVTGSCTALFMNVNSQLGELLGELKVQQVTRLPLYFLA